jgi:4-hydroxybenzoate polyprenyltransferase/phosphoserine phosphatase
MDSFSAAPPPVSGDAPIVVDLDETLLRVDTLFEGLLLAFGRSPLRTFSRFVADWRRPAALKAAIAAEVTLNVETLPLNSALIEWLRAEAARGRRIILATAAHRTVAEVVAAHLGFFDTVLASDGETNLKGRTKLDAIRRLLGDGDFTYVGDSRADLPVWEHCAEIGSVNTRASLASALGRLGRPVRRFDTVRDRPRDLLRGMRPHQWVKNLLVFLPLLAAHEWSNLPLVLAGVVAFAAFSLSASAVYLVNDLLDIQDDRTHAEKRHRPVASGAVRIKTAAALAVALFAAGLGLAAAANLSLAAILMIYVAATFAYSVVVKTRPAIDVIWLAGLYTVRVLAGAAATGIAASYWLLAFSIFVFLSLACAKRCSELQTYFVGRPEASSRRGYRASDLEVLTNFGVASAFSSVVILLMYLQDERVAELYARPQWLILVGALLLYWLCRLWLKARRHELHSDPIVFALRDRTSRYVLLAIGIVFVAAAGL